MMKKYLFVLVCLISYPAKTVAQGCSDAGFCTMGAMKPDQPFNKKVPLKLRSMEVSFYRGTTTLSPVVYVATLDMSFNVLDSKTFFQVKLPYQSVRGNFGTNSSLSDVSLCLTRTIYSTEKFDVAVSLGSKIPTNNADLAEPESGVHYPMYYQTSLGTYDAIAGVSVITKEWLFATGIQHPFNRTKNQFTWGDWFPIYEGSDDYVMEYDKCYELQRGTDVMLRVERNFRFSRINFSLGLLPIYRITKDEIFDTATNERTKVEGTTGLALSGIATAGYSFNVKSGVRFLFGHKITQRDVNPDGLTREMVTTVSYYYRF